MSENINPLTIEEVKVSQGCGITSGYIFYFGLKKTFYNNMFPQLLKHPCRGIILLSCFDIKIIFCQLLELLL
jgi:hypothetical protein